MLVTAILAALHVISAIGWLGGGIIFGLVIAPLVPKMGPASARTFLVTVGPRVALFFQVIAGLTVLFGLLLLYDMNTTGQGDFSFSNSWGAFLIVGMSIAFVAFLVSELLAVPALQKLIAVNQKMPADGSVIPAELPAAARRASLTALLTLVLLSGAFACMIGAGFY